MKEKLSMMFDGAAPAFVAALIVDLPRTLDCRWTDANWTWDAGRERDANYRPAWYGDPSSALGSTDFVAARVPCSFRSGDVLLDGAVYVESFANGRFYVALTPEESLCGSGFGQWVESLVRQSARLDPFVGDLVLRIGVEVSMPSEIGGSMLSAPCRSVGDIVRAYGRWRGDFCQPGGASAVGK